jgi:ribosomal protein S18 acetylase RimI-like enzyme
MGLMLGSFSVITDRSALYAATGDHPWVRMTTRNGDGVAYIGTDVIGWFGGRPDRATAGALGNGPAALDLVVALAAEGTVIPGTRAELPRMDHAAVHAAFPDVHVVDWDLRWLESAPAVRPGEDEVETLSEADFDEINEILDAALPDAHNRPGAPRINNWYGIRRDGRLLAVAADSSTPGFGFLNSIAVRPELHGGGLGSVLTARLGRDQWTEHGTALLGVWAHNVNASRLYHRLGYTGLHEMTAFTLPQ